MSKRDISPIVFSAQRYRYNVIYGPRVLLSEASATEMPSVYI